MIKSIINDCHKPIAAYIGSKQVWQNFTMPDLFKNGKQGVWYDPSDKSILFQDVAGKTPVTKEGDPVGLILDKSQGLEKVSYTFKKRDSGGWVDNGNGSYTSNGIRDAAGNLFFNIDDYGSGNKTFEVSYKVTRFDSGYIKLNLPTDGGYTNKVGEYKRIFHANSGSFVFLSHDFVGDISDITIREIKGNHATQGTASARPIYRTDGILHWLAFDGVDDTLSVQLPSGTYTEIKASRDGVTHKYPVNVNGSYTLGDLTQTKQSVSGLVLVNRQLTQAEIVNVTNLMKVKAGLPL